MPELIIIEVHCKPALAEILMAEMSEIGYESFQETDYGFTSSIPFSNYIQQLLEELVSKYDTEEIRWMKTEAEQENWNHKWEENYPEVNIDNEILIRAPFHKKKDGFRYELEIMPKMSFGTGHHETTALMLRQMLNYDFSKKSVLDAGCGTGVLGIMAAKLGASNVVANDIEEWACENAEENFQKNDQKARIFLGSIDALPDARYDFILANINKNVLLEQLGYYAEHLKSPGKIFLSGFYQDDVKDLMSKAQKLSLKKESESSKNNWAILILSN